MKSVFCLPVKAYLLAAIAAILLSGTRSGSASGDSAEWKMAVKMYSDTKAKSVGDLLTVIITEETLATKDAKSSSSKKSSISGTASFAHPVVDGRDTAWTNASLPAYSLETARNFNGDGSLENKEKFTASITVRVTDVMPNGNLLIEGKRSLAIQDETMNVYIAGTVRPADITRDNTVNSSDIADAVIKYTSKGPMVNNQKRGFVTRLWNWINPF